MKYNIKQERLNIDLKWLENPNNTLTDYGYIIRHLLNEIEILKQITK